MGHLRGMRVDREGKKKHIKKCDNCSETELTLDYIFNCLAVIPNLSIPSVEDENCDGMSPEHP